MASVVIAESRLRLVKRSLRKHVMTPMAKRKSVTFTGIAHSEPSVIKFTVYGEPVTQGSFAAAISKTTKKAILIVSNKTNWMRWRRAVNKAAVRAWGDRPPTDEPLLCEVEFYFGPPPNSHRGEVYCATKGDGDKLMRAILDGITALGGKKPQRGITTNDSRVVRGSWVKYWCDAEEEQRAVIKVNGLNRDLEQEASTLAGL